MLDRLFTHCLVRPSDVEPSHEGWEVVGTFNPGAVLVGDEVVLLVRVVEQPRETRPGSTALPRYHHGELMVDYVSNDELDLVDRRVVRRKVNGLSRLTFVSHLRVFRGKLSDPSRVKADPMRFEPQNVYEAFGVEDPRITRIGDCFYFTYVSVSPHGACTSLASTRDFRKFERHGVILPPENKDVLLFPEKIGGRYVAMHRPNPSYKFSPPEMWLAYSDDLKHWGGHYRLLGGRGVWSAGRIGGGCPPIRTERGWLEIYHGGAGTSPDLIGRTEPEASVGAYHGAAFITEAQDPARIILHSDGPIMAPQADFERKGFLSNIVFPTGIIEDGDTVLVYYGAADAYCGVIGFRRNDVVSACSVGGATPEPTRDKPRRK